MTLVIAHRGASFDLPENTLPAFERAIEVGADYVELDVHATPDGRLVVVHDRPRRDRSYPTLEEVLELTAGRIGVMVELKQPYRYRRHAVVRRTLELLDDDAVVVSFEPRAVLEVRRTAHWVSRAPGGHGAVREVLEAILRARGAWADNAVGPAWNAPLPSKGEPGPAC